MQLSTIQIANGPVDKSMAFVLSYVHRFTSMVVISEFAMVRGLKQIVVQSSEATRVVVGQRMQCRSTHKRKDC